MPRFDDGKPGALGDGIPQELYFDNTSDEMSSLSLPYSARSRSSSITTTENRSDIYPPSIHQQGELPSSVTIEAVTSNEIADRLSPVIEESPSSLMELRQRTEDAPPNLAPLQSRGVRPFRWTANSIGFARDYGDTSNMSQTIKTAMSFSSDAEAARALLFEANYHIKKWRESAETEAKLLRPIECWLGCGYSGRMEQLINHVRDDCPYRRLYCSLCREKCLAKDLTEHCRNLCPERRVGCPNAWSGCGVLVPLSKLDQHLDLRCIRRLVFCRLNCGAQIPFGDRDCKLLLLIVYNFINFIWCICSA